jgi:hypothetical protein
VARKRRHKLTVELVMSLLDYDPETGILIWAKDWYRGKKGTPVHFNKREGHLRIEIAGRLYSYARVCWMRHYGEDPYPTIVDHCDGNGDNNRARNLRLATQPQNARNHKRQHNNSSGKSGISYQRTGRGRKRWIARIGGDPRIFLGRFATKEEAIEARLKAEEAWGQFRPREAA